MTEFQITTLSAKEKALFFYSQNHSRKRRSSRKGIGRLKTKNKIMKVALLLILAQIIFFLSVVDVQSTQAFEMIGNFLSPAAHSGTQTMQEYIAEVSVLADKVAIVAMPVVIVLGTYMAYIFAGFNSAISSMLRKAS